MIKYQKAALRENVELMAKKHYMGVVQKSFHLFQAFRRTFAKLSQAFARGVLPLSAKMVSRWG